MSATDKKEKNTTLNNSQLRSLVATSLHNDAEEQMKQIALKELPNTSNCAKLLAMMEGARTISTSSDKYTEDYAKVANELALKEISKYASNEKVDVGVINDDNRFATLSNHMRAFLSHPPSKIVNIILTEEGCGGSRFITEAQWLKMYKADGKAPDVFFHVTDDNRYGIGCATTTTASKGGHLKERYGCASKQNYIKYFNSHVQVKAKIGSNGREIIAFEVLEHPNIQYYNDEKKVREIKKATANNNNKEKKKKDPNKPKLNQTPYSHYLADKANRARVKSENPGVNSHEVNKLLAAEYKNLSKNERAHWEQAAAEDKERYKLEMKSYTPPADLDDSDSDSDNESAPKKKKKSNDTKKKSNGGAAKSTAAKAKGEGKGKGAKKKASANSSSRVSVVEKKKPGTKKRSGGAAAKALAAEDSDASDMESSGGTKKKRGSGVSAGKDKKKPGKPKKKESGGAKKKPSEKKVLAAKSRASAVEEKEPEKPKEFLTGRERHALIHETSEESGDEMVVETKRAAKKKGKDVLAPTSPNKSMGRDGKRKALGKYCESSDDESPKKKKRMSKDERDQMSEFQVADSEDDEQFEHDSDGRSDYESDFSY